MLLPHSEVAAMQSLRLSPLGVVLQRDQRPRVIADYSFYGINADTLPMAPRESMQFGKVHERLLSVLLCTNPRLGAAYMYKIDISDGFC